MSQINVNTADKEGLMKIRDIGDKRAQLIIDERKNGPLTLESIKLIQGIPSTMWDPLIQAKRVTFQEELKEEPKVETEELVQLKQLVEKYKTEALILKQAAVTSSMENKKETANLQSNIDILQTEIKALTKQNELLASKLQDSQNYIEQMTIRTEEEDNKKDKEFKEEIIRQKELHEEEISKEYETIKVVKEENGQLQKENQKLMSKLQDQISIIEDLKEQNSQCIEENTVMESRISNLMSKVTDQAGMVDKANSKEKRQMTESLDQEKKIKNLESEIHHLKTSHAIDQMAPRSIYSKFTTTESRPEKETKKFSQSTDHKKTLLPPQFPKLSTYDRTNDWKAYHLQFTHTANRFDWDEQQKLDNFLLCLRGKALKFFSTRPMSVQGNFDLLMDKMTQRFGNKELPHSIRRQLQDAKQTIEESIEEYAERVQEMATDGYVEASEDIVEMMATEGFLRGCQDKQAALLAMDKDPKRVDQALQFVKCAMHNKKVLLGQKKQEVRKVQVQEQTDSDSDADPTVRVLNKGPPRPDKSNSWRQKLEGRMEKTEKEISGMKDNISKILTLVSGRRNQPDRSRSRSPSPRSPQRRPVVCCSCNETGHYSPNCPKKRGLSPPPSKPLNE